MSNISLDCISLFHRCFTVFTSLSRPTASEEWESILTFSFMDRVAFTLFPTEVYVGHHITPKG